MTRVRLNAKEFVPAASTRVLWTAAFGAVAGLLVGWAVSWELAPLAGWCAAAGAYLATTWRRLLGFNGELVQAHALREDPSRLGADAVLLAASIVSLAAVVVLLNSHATDSAQRLLDTTLSLLSVVASWFTIHTIFALRYAEMYYAAPHGGVDFGDTKTPVYADFAYLAFTLGMTFQVSDTNLKTQAFRRTALRHALMSYVFGTVIIAVTINLIAGLGQ
ncbi:MAG TPA: DUF1345 domain-containing protein [Candidatus Saccharimonadia bacterium]|jgi:uncharacterized membrane protein|nr:DUF1345 domain-containing protein [Candidatus Saccharimonadia bacterium]